MWKLKKYSIMSLFKLLTLIALLCVRGAYEGKNVPLDSFWSKKRVLFFREILLEIAFERSYDFCALMSAAPGQSVCKLTPNTAIINKDL